MGFWMVILFFLILFVIIPAGIFFGVLFLAKVERKYLVKNGIPVVARIESINKASKEYVLDNITQQSFEIVLQVEKFAAEYGVATIKHSFKPLKVPKAGDKINILIHPQKSHNIIVSPDQDN